VIIAMPFLNGTQIVPTYSWSRHMSGETILYIEDNEGNRMLIRRILEVEGYHIIEASDGNQGLELARKAKPDLILMDINLPGMDGYELTGLLKGMKHLRHVPVIAMTANVMKGDREKSLEAGCDGYIQKPVDVDQLPVQVARFLRKRKNEPS
jgi:two-component system cell cycle response regulator DivK